MGKPKLGILTLHLDIGGAERVISLLLKPLSKEYDVTLVMMANNVLFPIPDDIKVISFYPGKRIKRNTVLDKISMFINAYIRYRRIIKRENIQISMSFLALPNFINSLVAMTTRNVHTVISERCYPSEMYSLSKVSLWIAKFLYPSLYNRNDVLFSNSEHINSDLGENFGIKIPMKVVYNPIELPQLNGRKVGNGDKDWRFKLVNVGSFSRPKNQMMLLKALRKLDNDISLTLIGEGVLWPYLEKYAEENDISDRLIFTGRIKEVFENLVKMDCFVLSSITEGFPNVVLEAMAFGLPIISTNCKSGPLEILNENKEVSIEPGEFYLAKYGILIGVNDVVAMVRAINFLIENPDQCEAYKSLSLERVKDFSLPKIYSSLNDILEQYH